VSRKPPRVVSRLLERILPDRIREEFLGDLEESFRARIESGAGLFAAHCWYLREAFAAPLTLRTLEATIPDAIPPHHADGPMTNLLIDLRFALRMLARQPGFTAVVAITLALGIGATTAIFSAVYPILFAPLPYPGADRMVMVWERGRDGTESNVGYSTFTDLSERSRSLASSAVKSRPSAGATPRVRK